MDPAELARRRRGSRVMWSDGHYPTVAVHLRPAAERLVRAAGIGPGDRLLDVGTGSGSVALAAARCGADVVAVDQIDTWFGVARDTARREGARLELLVGDAEALPTRDAAFDAVTSGFAHIFAPRHDVVAAEMVRVCRPGGVVACTTWADDGRSLDAMEVIQRYLGTGQGPSPSAWGDPGYLRGRFADHGVELRIEQHVISWRFPSPQAHEDFLLSASGPYRQTRQALEAMGTWEEAWAELLDLDRQANTADDGTFAMEQPYLLAFGRRG